MTSCVLSSSFGPLHIFHGISHSSPSAMFFRILKMSPSQGSCSIYSPLTHMMVKPKWPSLSTYMTFFPWFMRKMSFLTNMLVFYLHTHFTNPHFVGFSAYRLKTCTHLNTYVMLLKKLFIILIQTILTGNCYKEGFAWIGYWFLAALLWLAVSSFDEPDEISLSLGPIRVFPYEICPSQEEAWDQTSLNILHWWSCTILCWCSHCLDWLSTIPSSNISTTVEQCWGSCSLTYSYFTSSQHHFT